MKKKKTCWDVSTKYHGQTKSEWLLLLGTVTYYIGGVVLVVVISSWVLDKLI